MKKDIKIKLAIIISVLLFFGCIFLYIFQFQLFSSIVNYNTLYIQVMIVALVLISLLFILVLGNYVVLTSLEKVKVLISGFFICVLLSPLILVLLNKLVVHCDDKMATAIRIDGRMTSRFGIVEGQEADADYIDVYFISDNGDTLKIRDYRPFPEMNEKKGFYYKLCSGITGLKWLQLYEK